MPAVPTALPCGDGVGAQKDPDIMALQEFITNHTVVHGTTPENVRSYAPGTHLEFDTEADAETIRHLRANLAIALPNELESAEETAARLVRLEQEKADLLAQLERLRAEQAEDAEAARAASAPKPSATAKPAAKAAE